MNSLHLYNSLTNRLEEFTPIDSGNIRMYACGPTVYSSPHIGNARPLVVFDVLFRLLKRLYGNVTYVRNLTDVDDKINKRAHERNISIKELTDEVIEEFHKNTDKLNLLRPTYEPRATFHIKEMLDIINLLVQSGFAYIAEGHVLFRVKKLENYGQLSKRSLEDMIPGSRVEVAPYKEDPLDFVLWKPSNENEPSWDSPFGKGRPGWHIECSAMSSKYLGKQFDIHAGGQDLIFPHHENEIAQNFGAFGCLMANYWIHNGLLLVNNQKMSKSLGNIISLDEILRKYDGEIIRYVLLSTHYQKTLNWTDQIVNQAKLALDRLYGALESATEISGDAGNFEGKIGFESKVTEALCNNLNTSLALQELSKIADKIYKSNDQVEKNLLCSALKKEAEILGLLARKNWFQKEAKLSEEEISKLLNERAQAKAGKNFQKADEIRNYLLQNKIKIEDTKDGPVWKVISE
ncbi:MAG: cysteine--tRNA ligase [Alphaproteobacteria bacterium]|nr:cysteine--tRNA ligase [Alphaproteobacteria bacterium]